MFEYFSKIIVETSYYDSEMNFKGNLNNSNSSNQSSSLYNQPMELPDCASSYLSTRPKSEAAAAAANPPTKHDDLTVEFYSSKPIEPNDLEIILLFLENAKQSGGGDSCENKLDPSKHLLTVKYEQSKSKARVIQKKILTFQQYKLIASEPFDEKCFKLDDKTIILANVSDKMNHEAVTLFAENLVVNDDESNDVECVHKSVFFAGM